MDYSFDGDMIAYNILQIISFHTINEQFEALSLDLDLDTCYIRSQLASCPTHE